MCTDRGLDWRKNFEGHRGCDSEGEAVSSYSPITEHMTEPLLLDVPRWYAVQTRPRHEKKVAAELAYKGVTHFLPLTKETHRWSDRRKVVEVPLFPCYAFVNLIPDANSRLAVLRVAGVLNFVGAHNFGLPIPDNQIEGIRSLLQHQVPMTSYPFLKIGQRVRICSGALDGMEGILVGQNGNRRLVISVDSIERSVAISIQGYDVEPA